jgi:hypothetical protein
MAWPRRLPVLSRPSSRKPREARRRSGDNWQARLAERNAARQRAVETALRRLGAAS